MLCMNCDYGEMELVYQDGFVKEYRCPKCMKSAIWYYTDETDTSDLDTQPITPIDDGADTIVFPRLDDGR